MYLLAQIANVSHVQPKRFYHEEQRVENLLYSLLPEPLGVRGLLLGQIDIATPPKKNAHAQVAMLSDHEGGC